MPIFRQYKGMLPKWAFYAHSRPVIKVDLQGEPNYHLWPVDMNLWVISRIHYVFCIITRDLAYVGFNTPCW